MKAGGPGDVVTFGAANVPATIATPMTTQKIITGAHSGIFRPAMVRREVCAVGPAWRGSSSIRRAAVMRASARPRAPRGIRAMLWVRPSIVAAFGILAHSAA